MGCREGAIGRGGGGKSISGSRREKRGQRFRDRSHCDEYALY